ncbi:serine/threonine-protein kinase [Streptomyces sp. NPDC091268]|uniref:serine/threonine-protein kinase n=1 Tax=Streptomyces sp. NPDC091268 TaxID=3365979 RepID=UPI003801443D
MTLEEIVGPELPVPGYRVGDWEVTGPIGSGGWGTVHAARPVPGADGAAGFPEVALKFLPTADLAPRQARKVAETARREVELGRRAGHPRLIRLLDSLVLADPDEPLLDGAIVLVMERAERSLRDLLEAGPPPTEAEGARLVTEICEGLAHLHAAGWVHGDLKPDNVLLMADGAVKLSDFGLATELTGTRGTHGYAPPMGTPDYLPPERWNAPLGEHGVQVRPSADIWALGIVIHEVFSAGASPFPGATPVSRGAATQEYAHGRAPLRLADEVPPFWRALAADCLAPDHEARAAHTAASLLARIAARSGPEARRRGPGAAGGGARGARATAAVAAAAVLASGGAAAALWAAYGKHGARSSQVPHRIRVFNAEEHCRDRSDRDPQCSLGLAVDPLRAYTADNVVPIRVWHGDTLDVDCRLAQGVPIVDESQTVSTEWFRVRLPSPQSAPPSSASSASSTIAWLPAVRTKDRPALPPCPRPTGSAPRA